MTPLGRGDPVRAYVVGVRRGWIGAAVWHVVRKAAKKAGLEKRVSTRTFRHPFAMHMLRKGAPIRQLQGVLGHASLETTQIYTRVTINDLHAMHRRFHPRERNENHGGAVMMTRNSGTPDCPEFTVHLS